MMFDFQVQFLFTMVPETDNIVQVEHSGFKATQMTQKLAFYNNLYCSISQTHAAVVSLCTGRCWESMCGQPEALGIDLKSPILPSFS